MNLGDRLNLRLDISGRITARTFDADPKFDIELPWGTLVGVPLSVIEEARAAEPHEGQVVPMAAREGSKEARRSGVTSLLPLRKRKARRLARNVSALARSG
jgi:hypothetical protein